MSLAQIKRRFAPGQVVTVTNHYINRIDHPCFGTQVRQIAKVSGSHLHFTTTGSVPWPKAADITIDGDTVRMFGHPKAGALFLTIELEGAAKPMTGGYVVRSGVLFYHPHGWTAVKADAFVYASRGLAEFMSPDTDTEIEPANEPANDVIAVKVLATDEGN